MMDRLDDEVLETGGDDENIVPKSGFWCLEAFQFLKVRRGPQCLFTANAVRLKQSSAGRRSVTLPFL